MAVHSVGDLTRFIKSMFDGEHALKNLMVKGEISNFKCYTSGHCYFTLKDNTAAIKCVMFKSRAIGLKFSPENGMSVIACGSVSVYDRDGVYQLYVDQLQPEGAGELAIAFEQIKQRLQAEGLFDESHKKPLPKFPKRIGVVTSLSGAVLRDIHHVSKRRNPNIQLVLYPVTVQGDSSAQEIANAIKFFNYRYLKNPVDLLIVGRGGGSAEDLWSFNEEPVVRAIYESELPVISAVGHETDFTLADFASDVRASTPSHAAEIAVPNVYELLKTVDGLQARMNAQLKGQMKIKQQNLIRLRDSQVFVNPKRYINDKRQSVDILTEALISSCKGLTENKRHQLHIEMERLSLLNPLKTLQRGYSLVENSQGNLVKSTKDIMIGDNVNIRLENGAFSATVSSIQQ